MTTNTTTKRPINNREGKGRPEGKKTLWQRKGEHVGGGFWIMRRGDHTNRIRPSTFAYEHGSLESAQEQLAKLKEACPEGKFIIVAEVRR